MGISNLIVNDAVKIEFKDIQFSEENKTTLTTFLKEFSHIEALSKYNLSVDNKILLYGHTGCGKTTTAKLLYQLLKKLGSRIDRVFGTQKEYEKILKEQSEALEKIEYHAEFLKNAISEDSSYYTLIEKILAETKKRIWTKTDDQ